MRLVVGLLEPLGRDMRVNLGGDEMGVAEQFLHAAQIRSGIEQVRGVAVTQLVRGELGIQTGRGALTVEAQLHDAGRDRFKVRGPGQKHRLFT